MLARPEGYPSPLPMKSCSAFDIQRGFSFDGTGLVPFDPSTTALQLCVEEDAAAGRDQLGSRGVLFFDDQV